MSWATDVRPIASMLEFLPVANPMPLKFAAEVNTEVTCTRDILKLANALGHRFEG